MVFEVLSEQAPAMARPDSYFEQTDDAVPCSLAPSPAPIPAPIPVPLSPALSPVPSLALAQTSSATPARTMPPAVLAQLLRSAVALQAEGLLRTAGALSGVWGNVLDRSAWIERDARDLSALTTAAVAAGASLPAGLDSGAGDPDHPSSVVEGLLASHEALVRVLREIAGPARPEVISTESFTADPITADPITADPFTADPFTADPFTADPITADPITADSVVSDSIMTEVKSGAVEPEPELWRRLVRGVLDRREEEILLLRAVGAAGRLPPEYAYRRGCPSPRY
jgi:hypothetical protein